MFKKAHEIKREQKKSLYLREIAQLLQPLLYEDKVIASIYPTRVDFSADCGICYVYFSTIEDCENKEKFVEDAFKALILYKPSLRSALAKNIKSRYTPDLLFLYDKVSDREQRVNELLDKVHQELTKK
jgi:ribosome-binding factor A